ncbi:winged helix-turn-helix domain-containing protein [Streptomyces sp. NPDC052164]|uniref:winged helix-turn-helix domain-containing protein n=1 Tax=Streptomyces sp. NPDC052164 TaxID=3155529 RepID=UPI0034412F68
MNGRATYRALADACGTSPDTVRRRLGRLCAAGMLQPRCEVARPLSEWPVTALLWGESGRGGAGKRLPFHHRRPRGTAVRRPHRPEQHPRRGEGEVPLRHPALRDTTHPAPPGLDITDRAVALRPLRLSGRLLDERGYRIGGVPAGCPHRRRRLTRSRAIGRRIRMTSRIVRRFAGDRLVRVSAPQGDGDRAAVDVRGAFAVLAVECVSRHLTCRPWRSGAGPV